VDDVAAHTQYYKEKGLYMVWYLDHAQFASGSRQVECGFSVAVLPVDEVVVIVVVVVVAVLFVVEVVPSAPARCVRAQSSYDQGAGRVVCTLRRGVQRCTVLRVLDAAGGAVIQKNLHDVSVASRSRQVERRLTTRVSPVYLHPKTIKIFQVTVRFSTRGSFASNFQQVSNLLSARFNLAPYLICFWMSKVLVAKGKQTRSARECRSHLFE